tara:strand:- start:805 stop:1014 length:210 start_codon:yes stop_codon:yes gene_type:complete
MALKLPERFIQVISFYVLLTLSPIIAFEIGWIKDNKIGDIYALLSVLVGVMWHIVGAGYVETGKLEISV